MLAIDHFDVMDGYVKFQLVGQTDLAVYIDLHKQAMEITRQHNLTKVMLDATQVTGPFMNTIDRFRAATAVEKFWDRRIWLALVATAEQIAPDKIGVLSANNRGMRAGVFISETEAKTWLMGAP
jgi:hypothetical protein